MKYAVKMTGPVQQVLQAMLEDPAVARYGLQISKQAGLETGTLYPVMARLERTGWVESSWEDPDLSISDGRPRRRYYQLTKDGRSEEHTSELQSHLNHVCRLLLEKNNQRHIQHGK